MDDLLNEFLTESSDNLAKLDLELVDLEKNPENPEILNSIFRTMHTIKGTCGFIGLPRLEKLAHAGENVLVKIRDGVLKVDTNVINIVLESIDGVKNIIAVLSEKGTEPEGDDEALIHRLHEILDTIDQYASFNETVTPPPVQETLSVATADVPLDHESVTAINDEHEIQPIISEQSVETAAQMAVSVPSQKAAPTENSTEKASSITDANQTIRVNINTLENLINMVSELVLTRNQLMQVAMTEENPALNLPLYRLNYVTTELQEQVMKTRMQPIGNAWLKLPRIVRDSSNELNKKIELELIGAETELDRQVIELIKDPLTHMIRNAMDHGLESPEERIQKGKPEKGTIRMHAYHAGGHIVIEISDDGRGISVSKIKAKALEKGLATQDEIETMTDSQVFQFIFKSGFSTAEQVTNISGRGVGMDVVRTNIEKIGGSIDIRSRPNKGTTFVIKIPLTLSIVSALIAEVAGYRFAIPQLNVLELVNVSQSSMHKIEYINERPVFRLRQRLLTLVNMQELLGLAPCSNTAAPNEPKYVVVLQVGTSIFGIIVDKVFNTQEIVVKPVSSLIRNLSIFAGNTILGDGGVILILDPNHIANTLEESTTAEEDKNTQVQENATATYDKEIFLLFYAGDKTPKAIPLSTLTRLEKIDLNKIEYSDGKPCIQYRESLMSLIFLSSMDMDDNSPPQKPVLVFSNHKHILGIVVDEIVDIVEGNMELKLESTTHEKLGVMILKDHATDIINTDYYLQDAFADWYEETKENHYLSKNLVFIGDHFYGANYLIPFLKMEGYHIMCIENDAELSTFFTSSQNVDGFILDLDSKIVQETIPFIQKNEAYNDVPKIALSNTLMDEKTLNLNNSHFIPRDQRGIIIDSINQLFDSTRQKEQR